MMNDQDFYKEVLFKLIEHGNPEPLKTSFMALTKWQELRTKKNEADLDNLNNELKKDFPIDGLYNKGETK